MWDCYTPCFSIWFRGNWPSAICSALLELDRRDVAFPAEEGPSEWGPQETLPFLWPLCWRVTSFYLTGPSSLLSSSECWNFHCGSMFQPVNTHIFHPSWGSSFGRAFLWRSLELIILYFILLYKQHSLAKEHNHKKTPLLGGLKTKRNSFCSELCGRAISLILLPSRKTKLTWPPSSWALALNHSFPLRKTLLWHTGDKGLNFYLKFLCFVSHSARHITSQGLCSVSVQALWQILQFLLHQESWVL